MPVSTSDTDGNPTAAPLTKRKRTRTRKGRKRTTDVVEEDDKLVSSSDGEDEEENQAKTIATTPVAAIADDYKNENSVDGLKKEKRKRKRTRGKGKKEEEGMVEAGAGAHEKDDGVATDVVASEKKVEVVPVSSPKAPSAELLQYLEKLGPPTAEIGLSERTVNALAYARQYHVDRANWKFNKAKQEYLIRHMLTPPIEPESVEKGPGEGGKAEGDEAEEGGNAKDQYWPDDWNRCVARYLATIQGKAKERLFEVLRQASRQEMPSLAHEVSSRTAQPSLDPPHPVSASTAMKSVSFGDLAMAQDATDSTQGAAPDALSDVEIRRIRFEKERAEKLLHEMQD